MAKKDPKKPTRVFGAGGLKQARSFFGERAGGKSADQERRESIAARLKDLEASEPDELTPAQRVLRGRLRAFQAEDERNDRMREEEGR